jgi:hypothetical protein
MCIHIIVTVYILIQISTYHSVKFLVTTRTLVFILAVSFQVTFQIILKRIWSIILGNSVYLHVLHNVYTYTCYSLYINTNSTYHSVKFLVVTRTRSDYLPV